MATRTEIIVNTEYRFRQNTHRNKQILNRKQNLYLRGKNNDTNCVASL